MATGIIGPVRLEQSARRVVEPTAPFHFDGTVFNPSHFPTGDQRWEPGRYWQTMRLGGEVYGVRLADKGTVERPAVEVTVFSEGALSAGVVESMLEELAWRFDLRSVAVPAFVERFSGDRLIGEAVRRRPGLRPKSAYALYEFLVITVVLQNTVVRRSVAMLRALFERFGRRVEFDGQSLWSFWPAEVVAAADEQELRALKLGYRAKTLKRQAEQVVRGEIDEGALRGEPDAGAIVRALDDVYGVGPQSAAYLVGEHFHRYERLDHVPPWEATIYRRLLDMPEATAEEIGELLRERYAPYPHLAAYCLWVDLFWRHREEPVEWLAGLIRL